MGNSSKAYTVFKQQQKHSHFRWLDGWVVWMVGSTLCNLYILDHVLFANDNIDNFPTSSLTRGYCTRLNNTLDMPSLRLNVLPQRNH